MKIKYRQPDIWRILSSAILISLCVAYAAYWARMISNPAERTGIDFIHFYAVGIIAQNYGFSSVYDLNLQQMIEQNVVGFELANGQVLPYNHIPNLIPILRILVSGNYVMSLVRWVLFLISAYLMGSIIFIHEAFLEKWQTGNLSLLSGMMTFYPFFISILLGQDTALLFVGVVLWCVGILKKNDWLSGFGLALTIVRPHICLMMATPFLFQRYKVWWRFLLFSSILVALSFLIMGTEGIISFVNILFVTASGDWYGTNQPEMMNMLGMLLRVLPSIDENIIRSVAWIGYFWGIGFISLLWLRAKIRDVRLLGLSIVTALFFAPHLHYHDLTLLVLPILLAFKINVPKFSIQKRTALLPMISLLLLSSTIWRPMHYSLPYILYFILVWILWREEQPKLGRFSLPI